MTVDVRLAEVHGLSRLALDGVGVTVDLVEQLHAAIAGTVLPLRTASPGRTRGITGLVYRSIRGVTGLVGGAVDLALTPFAGQSVEAAGSGRRSPLRAAINGIVGDHLERSANPLAIPMRLRHRDQALTPSADALGQLIDAPSSRLLIAVHGLCLDHRCWTPPAGDNRVDLPASLAAERGLTPLYLHYNTGRAIDTNGREFAELLEQLSTAWPVPLTELILLGHSMGGLVARSACHHGEQLGHRWTRQVRRVVCLGSPHHGAPLERIGFGLEQLLGASRYSAPFQRLGQIRSTGITDLRHGQIITHSGAGGPPTLPRLPAWAQLHVIAGIKAEQPDSIKARLIGDGLVPIDSALGRHRDPALQLPVAAAHQRVLPATSHIGLLQHPQVLDTLRDWID